MDINLTQIAELIAIAEQADIDELEVSEGHRHIRITCRSHPCGYHHAPSHPAYYHRHPNSDHHTLEDTPLTAPILFSKSTKPAPDVPAVQPTQAQATPADTDTHIDTPKPCANDQVTNGQATNDQAITSPMVGTFYRKSSPDAPAFIDINQTVNVGDTLCIIEAMKIMHEVKAQTAGVVRQILVNDGDMVEYAQPLIVIE